MAQNTSHAVMAQRHEPKNSLDYFPTPPWAVRLFIERMQEIGYDFSDKTCLEPACGQGHMAYALREYFAEVDAYDIENYGYGDYADFMDRQHTYSHNGHDWVITNPPFNLAANFIDRALEVSISGVAMLVRTSFTESKGRYNRLFCSNPPTRILQYVERVPMQKGKLRRDASTATAYCWVVWENELLPHAPPKGSTLYHWIPPGRPTAEYDQDYDDQLPKIRLAACDGVAVDPVSLDGKE